MTTQRFDIRAYEKRNEEEKTEFVLDDGTVVKQSDVGKDEKKNYVEYRIPPPPALFEEFRRFHRDGTLKLEGERFHSGLQYGIWKEYDPSGKLIEETDHEAAYELTFMELVELVREYHVQNEIPEVNLLDRNTIIARENVDEGKFWYFSWKSAPARIDVLKFDDKSGEVIESKNHELIGS